MTVVRQKENPPRGDNNVDGPPRESNATPTLTDWTDEASTIKCNGTTQKRETMMK